MCVCDVCVSVCANNNLDQKIYKLEKVSSESKKQRTILDGKSLRFYAITK